MDHSELTASALKTLLHKFYSVTVGVRVGLGSWQHVMSGCCHSCDASYFIQSVIDLVVFTTGPDHCFTRPLEIVLCITSLPNNPSSDSPPSCEIIRVLLSEVLSPPVAKSVLNSSSSRSSSLCRLLCCFCLLCAPRIMMKGQGYTEWGYSDCRVTEAINCWCRGRERRLGEKKIEIFCSLNYWVQAKPYISTGLHKGLCLGYYFATIHVLQRVSAFSFQLLSDVACTTV